MFITQLLRQKFSLKIFPADTDRTSNRYPVAERRALLDRRSFVNPNLSGNSRRVSYVDRRNRK